MASFFHDIRLLPRPFWVLVGATFVNRFGIFVWPFLTLYITRSGHSATQASWAVAAYSGGGFFAALLGGWLADRLGRNVTLALSALGGAACMLLLSQAQDWRWLSVIAPRPRLEPTVAAVKKAFTDVGRDVPDEFRARTVGARDVE